VRYLSTVFILSIVTVLASCSFSDDGYPYGSCPEIPETIITGLGQSTLLMQSDEQLESGLVQFELIQTPRPIQADRFMLAVVANAQFAAAEIKSSSSLLARIGSFFVSDADALSCAAPDYVSEQPLADITITSDADFSTLYPASSNLAPLFRVGQQNSSSPLPGEPIGSLVARAPENRESLAEFLSAQPAVPLLLAMTLDIENPTASQHVFTITYTLEDGNSFSTQTEPVSITP